MWGDIKSRVGGCRKKGYNDIGLKEGVRKEREREQGRLAGSRMETEFGEGEEPSMELSLEEDEEGRKGRGEMCLNDMLACEGMKPDENDEEG